MALPLKCIKKKKSNGSGLIEFEKYIYKKGQLIINGGCVKKRLILRNGIKICLKYSRNSKILAEQKNFLFLINKWYIQTSANLILCKKNNFLKHFYRVVSKSKVNQN